MKPLPVDITRHGSLGGEEVAMTFDENSIAHIMSVLTDLYSDSEMAIIREYATNAHDSHIAAGNTDPIEVTLPATLHPYLTIQDYGVGMSKDDIINIYSKYGASTKRNTNDQSGTLGLGCKSALTYTSQFTVTAVKDGTKTVINVSRHTDGSGVMELISSSNTDEPNGVRVQIPVADHRSLCEKAYAFFSYWKPNTVLVNGKEPSTVTGIRITDSIHLVAGLSHDIVVMGNVAYRVSSEYSIANVHSYYRNFGVVAWLPIGSVAFTPNREDLRYTELTQAALKDARQDFMINASAVLQKQIEDSPTAAAAIKTYLEVKETYGGINNIKLNMIWKGRSFKGIFNDNKYIRYTPDRSRYSVQRGSSLDLADVVNGIFITGMPDIELSSFYKKKIRQLLADDNVSVDYYTKIFIMKDQPLADWFDNARQYTWEDVKAVKIPGVTTSTGQRGGKQHYKLFESIGRGGGWWKTVDELDTTKPIYYGTTVDAPDWGWFSRLFDADDQVVAIGRNRWDKFVRDFPTAKSWGDGEKIKRQDYLDNVPQDVVDSLLLEGRHELSQLDESKIDDPVLKAEVVLSKVDTTQWQQKFYMFNQRGSKKNSMNKYPLVDMWDLRQGRLHSHLYIYINAVYNDSKEN